MAAPDGVDALVELSRELGRPELDYVIFGEGNTSLRRDDESFWVKASGAQLHTADRAGFVAVRFAPMLALLEYQHVDRAALQHQVNAAVCAGTGRPSTEVVLHALALTLGGAVVVGHTHPTPLLSVLCSADARLAAEGRLFPDEVIVCGRASAYVPYAAPGLPLAHAVRAALLEHQERWSESPRVILLENHGLIALGQTPADVLKVTATCVKAACVLLGSYAHGGPRFLTNEEVDQLAGYARSRAG